MSDFRSLMKVEWEEKGIDLDTGIYMGYTECGPKDGQVVLLLHGVTDSRMSWAQVAPMLAAKGCHCYAIDYRGNGTTDKPDMGEGGYTADIIADDLVAFIRQLDLKDIHIVGHSYGSMIGQRLALQETERYKSLTLIDTCVNCRGNVGLTEGRFGDGKELKGICGYGDKLPEDFIVDWFALTNDDPDFCAAVLQQGREMPIVAWKNLLDGCLEFQNYDRIGSITLPILVLWGTEDVVFPKDEQDRVKEYLKNCDVTYIDVEGASHNAYWDNKATAARFADYIYNFVCRHI